MKHTPGPWISVLVSDLRGGWSGYSVWQDIERPYANSPMAVKICSLPDGTTAEALANARLLAAAPELLKSLEVLIDEIDDYEMDAELSAKLQNARLAIAKARGK